MRAPHRIFRAVVPPLPVTPSLSLVVIPRPGSWRYFTRRRSRWIVPGSALFAASLHAAILFGIHHGPRKTVTFHPETLMVLDLELPKLEEIDEPEPVTNDEPRPVEDLGLQVPMQADSPQLPQPSDFVQTLDFASMTPQPVLDRPKTFTIPGTINRGGKVGDGLGKVFSLKELDRQPVPISQPAPIPPTSLVQEGATGSVTVEFIVLPDGNVSQAMVRDSTDYRFNEAAVNGVSRWKFKPGMKNGRKVNTRMIVPIVFKPKDSNG